MRKLTLCSTALTLLAISAPGEVTRQRYLVATRTAAAKVTSVSYDDRELAARDYRRFSSVEGYSLQLSEVEALILSQRPDVRYVEPDRVRWLASGPHLDVAQELLYGIAMVSASGLAAHSR